MGGYDQAVALPALQADGKGGQEELFKESNKVFDIGKGAIEMEVNKVNAELGEIGGVFVSKQPSDGHGRKGPEDGAHEGHLLRQGRLIDAVSLGCLLTHFLETQGVAQRTWIQQK